MIAVEQLRIPEQNPSATGTRELVTITSEALVAASYAWAEKRCFSLAMWLSELSDAAKLDQVPLRLDPKLAGELGLMKEVTHDRND